MNLLRLTRRRAVPLLIVVIASVTACTGPSASATDRSSPPASMPAASTTPTASLGPSASSVATEDATTLRTLIAGEPEAPALVVDEALPAGDGYTSASVTYESGGFTIRGVLRTPDGEGPVPGVVFVHGGVEPDTWSAETEYGDEQERLVTSGYAVLVPDLRNHGDSDDDPAYATDLEMGTTLDVVNAARALATAPGVDPERIAVIGHSLGGAITLNAMVVAPEVAAAFVALAPAHPSAWENIEHFVPAGSPFYVELTALRGTPDENPDFWADVSSLTFVDRVAGPLLVVYGTADDVVPPAWPEVVRSAWEEAGKDVELVTVDGGDHVFQPSFDEAWAAIIDYLAERLVAPAG